MLEGIRVRGYKCLLMDEPLRLGSLNVLVGANASGKSTLLQSLLLLRQSADSKGAVAELHLSGDLFEAGTANDVLHPAAGHAVEVDLVFGGESHQYKFRSNRELPNKRRLLAPRASKLPEALGGRRGKFSYLNAERIGPRVSYSLPPDDVQLSGPVGKFGEFTAGYLARSADEVIKVDKWGSATRTKFGQAANLLDGLTIDDLLKETGGRIDLVANLILSWIIPRASFSVAEESGVDSVPLRFIRDPLATKVKTRATHVGFGLAYSLPIIVAGLSLKCGGVILIENPEAHLHPFGQSRMGAFLAALAATGRQIFVETHSDHVVNGIRLAMKKGVITSGEVTFNYFRNSPDGSTSAIAQISAGNDGALEDWPPGFFDQIEHDLSRL